MYRRRDRTPLGSRYTAPVGLGMRPRSEPETAAHDHAHAPVENGAGAVLRPDMGLAPGHPLTDAAANAALLAYERNIKGRFARLVPVLKRISGLQHETDFEAQAQAIARAELGFELPLQILQDAWVEQLDMRALFAYGMFHMFEQVVNEFWNEQADLQAEAERAIAYFLDCDFHEVDITPCSDGRLMGLIRFVLRVPHQAVRVRSYAGAMFDIESDVRHWTKRELIRFREGVPNTADAPTRYLKIAAYHYSSSNPAHEGCAAHGSNERDAAEAALTRLREFRQAIQNTYCCGASVDTLLIGVDTDTDAIKVHVPDSDTRMSVYRYVDSAQLYRDTQHMDGQAASLRVYQAIQQAIDTSGWGAGNGPPHEGMLRLISQLLVNNMAQIDYVASHHAGRYADIGHKELFVIAGDSFEELQIRNMAYFANLDTVEEGAADLDVGINKIFRKLNASHGLPIPVIVHYRYNGNVPGARERTIEHCQRVKRAIETRYADLAEKGLLFCSMFVRDKARGSRLEPVGDH